MGKEANISKAQNLHGKRICRCGRYKCGGDRALPGEISEFFFREVSRRHSNSEDYRSEGQNLDLRLMNLLLTEQEGVAGVGVEKHQSHCRSIAQQARGTR